MLEQPQEEETKELKTTSVEIKMIPQEDNATDCNKVPQSLEETEKAISTRINSTDKSDGFYSISKDYWAKQPPTVNGMLGGYEYVSQDDIEQSQQFLNYFINVRKSFVLFRKQILKGRFLTFMTFPLKMKLMTYSGFLII